MLAGIPKMRAEGLSFWKVMDMAVPCVAMGIIVGRVGDLIIADHLGKPTHFFLGYVCPSHVTGSPCLAPIGQAVHQPALYDFVSAIFLLLLLLRLRKTVRYDGFLTLVFGAWYGTGRFMEDFFRIDVTHGTGLTGSQWTALTVTSLCLYCLVVLRTPRGRADGASSPPSPAATAAEVRRAEGNPWRRIPRRAAGRRAEPVVGRSAAAAEPAEGANRRVRREPAWSGPKCRRRGGEPAGGLPPRPSPRTATVTVLAAALRTCPPSSAH